MSASEAYYNAIELGIKVPRDISLVEVCRVYNGIGPEWMAGWIRKCLDFFFEVFLPAVWMHDYRYAHGDGTLKDFMDANRELGENCRICADAKYGWCNPLRYAAHWVGNKFAKVCDISGLPAYIAAIEETNKHKKQQGEVK
jgi:hypothetical protein